MPTLLTHSGAMSIRKYASTAEFAKNHENNSRIAVRAIRGLGLVFAMTSLVAAALGFPGPWALLAALTVLIVWRYLTLSAALKKSAAEIKEANAQGFVIALDDETFTYVKTRIPWANITDVLVGDTRRVGPLDIGELGMAYLRVIHSDGQCRTRIGHLLPSAVTTQMLTDLKRQSDERGISYREVRTRREFKKLLRNTRKKR